MICDGNKLNLVDGSSFTRYCHSGEPVRRKRELDKIS
jgi:hypothetical protein